MGRKPDDPVSPEPLAEEIRALRVKNVIITLGEHGAYMASADGQQLYVPAFKIDSIDTTGAGDTFTAALAVALSEGRGLPEAVLFANAAAALTCTRKGVVPSLPNRKQTDALFESRYK